MATFIECMMVEDGVETSFCDIIGRAIPQQSEGEKIRLIYKSREASTAETPRIEVKYINGDVVATKDHEKVFPAYANLSVYDAWVGELEITIVTNRTTEQTAPAHTRYIGIVRAACQKAVAISEWNEGATHYLVDIRELGTVDTVDTVTNLDTTAITFYCLIQVNPSAWPATPELTS